MPEAPNPAPSQKITPELVRKVADRVYALMLLELKRQRERGMKKRGRR